MSEFDNFLMGLSPEAGRAVSDFYGYNMPASYDRNDPYANINPYAYAGLDPRNNPGDKLYADIIRAQTQDYRRRFAPIEDALAATVTPTGTTALEGDLARTREAFIGSGQNIAGQRARGLERYGVEREQGFNSQNAMVGAMVGGLNDTRMRDQDRRMALLSGGLNTLATKARSN